MGFKWKRRGKKWKLSGNLRSYFKSLYVPCTSPMASLDAKTTKREETKQKRWKKYTSTVSIPIAETTSQGITINSKEFQIQGLLPFSSWWLVSLLIIRADRKIWLWCVCCCTPPGREGNSDCFSKILKVPSISRCKTPRCREKQGSSEKLIVRKGTWLTMKPRSWKDPNSQCPPGILAF